MSAIIFPFLVKFIKHNYFFSNLFIRKHLCDYLNQSKNKVIKVNARVNDHSMNLLITSGKNNIFIEFINNVDCRNRFSFQGNPSSSKFLLCQLPKFLGYFNRWCRYCNSFAFFIFQYLEKRYSSGVRIWGCILFHFQYVSIRI